MSTYYYYLVSGLPNISIIDETLKFEFSAVLDTMKNNLSNEDKKLFKYLLHINDNKNLVRAIEKSIGLEPVNNDFLEVSAFDEDTISRFNDNTSQFPKYMSNFIENYSNKFSSMSRSDIENMLLTYFYDEVLECDDEFLCKYFDFDKNLRNIISAYNLRNNNIDIQGKLIGGGYTVDMLEKSRANDFGLGADYPYVNVINESFEKNDAKELEYTIIKIRFEYIDDITIFESFTRANVYAYFIKLSMLERWTKLDDEIGKKRLEEIVANMKKNAKMPEL